MRNGEMGELVLPSRYQNAPLAIHHQLAIAFEVKTHSENHPPSLVDF